MAHTRTHTHYFGDEDLETIREEFKKLHVDAASRAPYIGEPLRQQMMARIDNLRIAIDLLGEAAD